VSFKDIATFYAHAGDNDTAVEYLERAADARESNLVYVVAKPDFADVRREPGFTRILDKMNLTPRP